MHEISLVQGLLAKLAELAEEHKATEIQTVRVEIGPFSGIVTDSFQFGFDALVAQSALTRRAKLEISTPEQQYRCCQCGHIFIPVEIEEKDCPECGGDVVIPEGGDGLILLQVEME
ncbi:MAG: hydrogenase maturation nickel metallochaperone HypA [Desulfobulbaceae bacterium]|nr:hydrogenase maturation nickel metallochaperone HypA [Desulfobulbaceae bacterium]